MYAFSYGPEVYDAHRDGSPISLVAAVHATYGVGAARIYRIQADGTLLTIVRDAGSAYAVTYVPKERRIVRKRLVRAESVWVDG